MTWYNDELDAAINAALARTLQIITPPSLAQAVRTWITALSPTDDPADYFKHPLAVPFILFPWWLEDGLTGRITPDLQADLIFSSVNAYYHTRLLDNIMDGDTEDQPHLLPLAAIFHTHFQRPYHRWFQANHPFWAKFQVIWFNQAEATRQDALANDLTADSFQNIVAQKVSGIKIPMIAICYYHQQTDLITPWNHFVDRFGAWHMFYQDLFDWHKDWQHGNLTYFLYEGRRRCRANESLPAWAMREGVAWGIGLLRDWMNNLQDQAQHLNAPALSLYLAHRAELLNTQYDKLKAGLALMAHLADLEQPTTHE